MTKLINLLYINILNLFDLNKILIANEKDTKSGYEYKPIIVVIISLVLGYISYQALLFLGTNLNNKILLIDISFLISSIISLLIGLYISKKELFNQDSEYLFSLPISKNQIIITKLFNVYIKTILFVLIIISMSLLAYNYYTPINKTIILITYVSSIFIPIIPIIISSIITYYLTYLETNNHKIISVLSKILILIILMLLYKSLNISTNNIDSILVSIINDIGIIYIPILLFNYAISKLSLLSLLCIILLSLLLNYIFIKYLSNNYNKLNSLLKGIKTKEKFKYHKISKHSKFITLLIKEKNILLNNKKYFQISYNTQIFITIILLICLNIIDLSKLNNVSNVVYISLLPALLSLIVCINSSTISSISIEKKNIEIIKTYPINLGTILLSKYILSILIGSIFIIINSTLINIYLKLNTFLIILNYILPLISLLFTNLLYLTLDLKYPVKDTEDDNIILSTRILSFIPPIVSIIIGIIPIIFPLYADYQNIILCETFILFILLIINIIYLLINKKKLYKELTR